MNIDIAINCGKKYKDAFLPLKIQVVIEYFMEDYLSTKIYRLTPDITFTLILT